LKETEVSEIDKGVFSSFQAAMAKIKENHSKISEYETPWWGDRQTEHIKNRGYVIGLKNATNSAQWRLDYDPMKKLHINWTHELKGGTVKEYYQISSTRPQSDLWDYYVSWTKSRSDDIPPEIKGRLDEVNGVKKWYGRFWA
jgi:hypothetical protein